MAREHRQLVGSHGCMASKQYHLVSWSTWFQGSRTSRSVGKSVCIREYFLVSRKGSSVYERIPLGQ